MLVRTNWPVLARPWLASWPPVKLVTTVSMSPEVEPPDRTLPVTLVRPFSLNLSGWPFSSPPDPAGAMMVMVLPLLMVVEV